jgi:hypothetical protein
VATVLLVHTVNRVQTLKDVMLETSGRDIAMFHYVDTFFPNSAYRKLVVHFRIDALTCAELSVRLLAFAFRQTCVLEGTVILDPNQ